MTIEVAILISAVSVAFGIYQGISNLKRNVKNDTKADASQLTTVTVYYQLATPVTYPISLPEQVKTFYPFTQFYTDVNAPIEVGAKVMD